MTRYAMFGEIMMRLKAPGYERLFQTPSLEVTMAGAEANVAVGLGRLDEDVSFITALPTNDLGNAVRDELRKHGVDVSKIAHHEGRLGLYFVETGANQRPIKVVYDRADSCIAKVEPTTFDWRKLLADRDWFHITGITPAISETAMRCTLEAMKTAKEMGLTVSCDLNLRAALWQYGFNHVDVYRRMMEYVDVLVGNEGHFDSCLGLSARVAENDIYDNPSAYRPMADEVFEQWPNIKKIAITVRRTQSADHQSTVAILATPDKMWTSPVFEMKNIIDRIGGGDAFTTGFLYALDKTGDSQETIDFAVAAGAMKHSIPGDFLRATKEEIQALADGAAGRDQR
ncbi:2-dehydro-3-deoxygluconokinase [Pseudodesulfovibrio nedwellii]|uniref:2-dehydro-3-deoxygluconokinase n=1 Tax=Pseudodesulfovibrio nedwellii TaxID=2973072 RepID=A0ABN6S2P1_9BACT|nr:MULTISPECIES: sugar kinase [Pseudodesulfovibrio]BDQ36572.1 2-dehydro-3-deoxygluconokinase [Pseudodesulfovibrio nedwellii]